MKKTIFLSVLIAFCFSLASYPQFSIGPRLGLNLSSFGFDYKDADDEPETKFKLRPQFGIMFAYQFIDQIGIRAAIVYSNKGTAYNRNYTETQNDGTIYSVSGYSRRTLNYFEIPVDGTFGVKAGKVYIFGNVGPYFAITYGGKGKWDYDYQYILPDGSIENGSVKDDIKIRTKNEVTMYEEDVYYVRPIDYGLNLGLGLKVKFFMFNVQYGLGLANLTPHYTYNEDYQEDHKKYNRGFSIYFAFLFGKSKEEEK